MGAEPLAAFLALALPSETEVAWVDAFTRGLEACAREYGCALAGGDTVRSPQHLTITVALLGTVERGRALLRSGAQVGDAVCVTGTLGDSAAGLALLQSGVRGQSPTPTPTRKTEHEHEHEHEHEQEHEGNLSPLLAAHLRPMPRLRAARALAASGRVTAMMDLSDGLASDLRHIAARSGVGARVRREALPISDAVRAAAARLGVDPTEWALHGGEDYELLFTLPESALGSVQKQLGSLGVPMTVVGEITKAGVLLTKADGRQVPLQPAGFAHFAKNDASDASDEGR
jgi:thiamine-monophosphate kinase